MPTFVVTSSAGHNKSWQHDSSLFSLAAPEYHYRHPARDFWFEFDGICAFTIVMGIFVLLRV